MSTTVNYQPLADYYHSDNGYDDYLGIESTVNQVLGINPNNICCVPIESLEERIRRLELALKTVCDDRDRLIELKTTLNSIIPTVVIGQYQKEIKVNGLHDFCQPSGSMKPVKVAYLMLNENNKRAERLNPLKCFTKFDKLIDYFQRLIDELEQSINLHQQISSEGHDNSLGLTFDTWSDYCKYMQIKRVLDPLDPNANTD